MSIQTQFISLFLTAIAMVIAGSTGSALVHFSQKKVAQNSPQKIAPTNTFNPTLSPTPTKILSTKTPIPTVLFSATTTPIPTATPIIKPLITDVPPDTSLPITNVFYPQDGGEITYKIDGKVCAIMSAPSDDSGFAGVETFYAFDGGSFQKGVGYLCADVLPNGPHTLSFYSKDQAGNTETTRTISFTVNIEGN